MSRPLALAGVLVAAATFAAIAAGVASDGSIIAALDRATAAWIASHATPRWTQFMTVVSELHRPRGIAAVSAVAALWLAWRRRPARSLLLLAALAGGATLNHLLKHAFLRPRPGADAVLAASTNYSFPSGHAANATLLYGALAALVVIGTRSSPLRAAAVAGAVLAVLLVGASRLVLNAHYASDVLAGIAVGLGWLALCRVGWLTWRDRARS